MRRTHALIAGGGPAGSAAAIVLAGRHGRPLLIERHRDPHDVVCGGFLGWDALAALERLGLDAIVLGARPIGRMRLIAGDRIAEADLPRQAAGLSRRILDEALLAHAAKAGAAIERGTAIRGADERTLRLADGATIAGDALFLATGKHELRGLARPGRSEDDLAIGLRTRLAPSAALGAGLNGVIELHLFRGGYAGLLLQEDGSANLCLSVARSRLGGRNGAALIADLAREAPRLAERFGSAAAIAPWQAIAAVPYGWRARTTVPGLFRIGDQSAVIASLAGDGVAIALRSGQDAAAAWLRDGADGAIRFQHRFAAEARRPLRVAGTLRRIAETGMAPSLVRLLARMPGAMRLLARSVRIEP